MFVRTAIILILVGLPLLARAQGVVRDDFEGPEASLRPAGGDGRHRVELHQRVDTGAHSGRRAEQVRIAGGGATAIYYSYPIRPARVIGELAASVWIRSDRPGLQLVARVVLPRSKHPTSGEPLTTLLRGSDYTQVGSWQMLTIGNLPRALEWQVRVLRSQFGPQIDAREAYVDMLLVNVYGGAGTTNVWFDDLEIVGAVPPSAVGAQPAAFATSEAAPDATPPGSPDTPSSMPRVEYRNRLLVGGEPFFPRIIEHRGEPFARLQALGFNCVQVHQLPTPEMLADAARLKLWLIAPPPTIEQLQGTAGTIPPLYDPVLAWNLGSNLAARDLDAMRLWAEAVRVADGRQRPIVCGAVGDLANYSRPPFKVLITDRDPLGSSLELSRFSDWLSERAQLARAGTPLWVRISTQPAPALVEQMRLAAGEAVPPPLWQEAQLRAVVHAALAARARGLYFASQSRLDATDPATTARAAMLELLNLELQLIERWPAAGNAAAMADTSDPHTTGAVIETDHSRLLMPIYAPPGGQHVVGTQPAAVISFIVAGVPEGDNAYELSLTGLHPLRPVRLTGGTQVVLNDRSRESLVVFTRDPYVLRNLKQGLEKIQRRALYLVRELAALETARVDATTGRLTGMATAIPLAQEARATVANDLRQSESLAESDIPRSYAEARHALAVLRQLERLHWEQAIAGPEGPLADPLTASFSTLPEYYRFRQQIAAAPRTPNRLPEGMCENLAAMQAAGWRHYQHRAPGIETVVDWTPRAAHSGAAGLMLRAKPIDEKQKPGAVETPPVWITTAPVGVEAGDLVQIQAWVRIDAPIAGSTDGLVILDTQSGEPLALRLTKTEGWRQVTLYRVATQAGTLAVSFALAGLGEAAIDDVTISIVQRGAATQPFVPPPGQPQVSAR